MLAVDGRDFGNEGRQGACIGSDDEAVDSTVLASVPSCDYYALLCHAHILSFGVVVIMVVVVVRQRETPT